MKNVTLRYEVLKLNRLHQPVGFFTPKKVFIALANWKMDRNHRFILDHEGHKIRKMLAYDVDYYQNQDGSYDFAKILNMRLVDWDTWVTLPIRSYDLTVHTPNKEIRVPRIVMSLLSDDMPMTSTSNSLNSVYDRYDGVCQYTHKKLKRSEASRDHVIPRSKGGKNTASNIVLSSKAINSWKGDRFIHDCGLPEVVPIIPKKMFKKDVLRNTRRIPEFNWILKR